MFSLRIVNVDHYSSPPKSGIDLTYSQFRGSQIKALPVIRIFGSTSSGLKTCLHVHGVFPYLLVPYSGQGEAGRFLYQLASSLDKAINVSLGTSNSQKQHVFKITQVSGRPFYGYHGQDHQFLKIFFYSPLIIKRANDLLQNGAVCGTQFQVHESHVPFILQFFIDYNLYGMSFINVKSVVYRKGTAPLGVACGEILPESTCELEADAVAVDILNRLTVEGELAVNPGLAAIWREERERLQRDVLDVSQRLTPRRTLSEMMLHDKLKDNLKCQGKCKPTLKERLPYPAETQRSDGSEVLDASVLDTHAVSSLVAPAERTALDMVVVDEELALSLSQNTSTSMSLDQSLLTALDVLALAHEVAAPVIAQDIDDDSILGSQMLPHCDEEEAAAMDFTQLPDHDTDSGNEESDENFEDRIPQLDGISEIMTRKKKCAKRKRQVLAESAVTENNIVDMEECLINIVKDGDCWPDPLKDDGVQEIFSDDEPFNSPMHNYEDNVIVQEEELFDINVITNFDKLLNGDPILNDDDAALSEEFLISMEKNEIGDWTNQYATSEHKCSNVNCTSDSFDKPVSSNADGRIESGAPPDNLKDMPFNESPGSTPCTDLDKQMPLHSFCDDFLSTCQLDEMFDEDLNKGLDIICCEKNSQFDLKNTFNEVTDDFSQNTPEPGTSCQMEIGKSEQEVEPLSNGGVLVSNTPVLVDNQFENKYLVCVISQDIINPFIPLNVAKVEDSNCERNIDKKEQICAGKQSSSKSIKSQSRGTKINCKRPSNSPSKSINLTNSKNITKNPNNHRLLVKIIRKKIKKKISCGYNSYDMTEEEINKYFAQLEYVAHQIAQRGSDLKGIKPIVWTPIRCIETSKIKVENQSNLCISNNAIIEKLESPTKSCYNKIKKLNIKKKSGQDMSNLYKCHVKLQRLTFKIVRKMCIEQKFFTDLRPFKKRHCLKQPGLNSVDLNKIHKIKKEETSYGGRNIGQSKLKAPTVCVSIPNEALNVRDITLKRKRTNKTKSPVQMGNFTIKKEADPQYIEAPIQTTSQKDSAFIPKELSIDLHINLPKTPSHQNTSQKNKRKKLRINKKGNSKTNATTEISVMPTGENKNLSEANLTEQCGSVPETTVTEYELPLSLSCCESGVQHSKAHKSKMGTKCKDSTNTSNVLNSHKKCHIVKDSVIEKKIKVSTSKVKKFICRRIKRRVGYLRKRLYKPYPEVNKRTNKIKRLTIKNLKISCKASGNDLPELHDLSERTNNKSDAQLRRKPIMNDKERELEKSYILNKNNNHYEQSSSLQEKSKLILNRSKNKKKDLETIVGRRGRRYQKSEQFLNECQDKAEESFSAINCDISVGNILTDKRAHTTVALKNNFSLNNCEKQRPRNVKAKNNIQIVDDHEHNYNGNLFILEARKRVIGLLPKNNNDSTKLVPISYRDCCNIICSETGIKADNASTIESATKSTDTIFQCSQRRSLRQIYSSAQHIPLETKNHCKSVLDNDHNKNYSVENECLSHDSIVKSMASLKVPYTGQSNILSLDGTFDSSSSDETVEEIGSNFKSSEGVSSTPLKRKRPSSKVNRTPKHDYVPLKIEIKKSPKVKLHKLSEIPSTSRISVNISQFNKEEACLETDKDKNAFCEKLENNSVSMTDEEKCEFDRKRRRTEPSVRLERLCVPQNPSVPSIVPGKASSSSINPKLKKLEVAVRRLSLKTQGSEVGKANVESRPRRSSSLTDIDRDEVSSSWPHSSFGVLVPKNDKDPTEMLVHPSVRRLKVSVKRLDFSERGSEVGKANVESRPMRSSSLPDIDRGAVSPSRSHSISGTLIPKNDKEPAEMIVHPPVKQLQVSVKKLDFGDRGKSVAEDVTQCYRKSRRSSSLPVANK